MYKFTVAKSTVHLLLSVGRKLCGAFKVRALELTEYEETKIMWKESSLPAPVVF